MGGMGVAIWTPVRKCIDGSERGFVGGGIGRYGRLWLHCDFSLSLSRRHAPSYRLRPPTQCCVYALQNNYFHILRQLNSFSLPPILPSTLIKTFIPPRIQRLTLVAFEPNSWWQPAPLFATHFVQRSSVAAFVWPSNSKLCQLLTFPFYFSYLLRARCFCSRWHSAPLACMFFKDST